MSYPSCLLCFWQIYTRQEEFAFYADTPTSLRGGFDVNETVNPQLIGGRRLVGFALRLCVAELVGVRPHDEIEFWIERIEITPPAPSWSAAPRGRLVFGTMAGGSLAYLRCCRGRPQRRLTERGGRQVRAALRSGGRGERGRDVAGGVPETVSGVGIDRHHDPCAVGKCWGAVDVHQWQASVSWRWEERRGGTTVFFPRARAIETFPPWADWLPASKKRVRSSLNLPSARVAENQAEAGRTAQDLNVWVVFRGSAHPARFLAP